MKRYFIILGLVILMGSIIIFSKQNCDDTIDGKITKERTCFIVPDKVYDRLSNFCDCHYEWVQIASYIKNAEQHKVGNNTKFIPYNYWGTKLLECADNSNLSDLDDSDVFLYTTQDTILSNYDGAITYIRFGNDDMFSRRVRLNDVGKENKKIVLTLSDAQIDYLIEEDGVNIEVLEDFRHAINFDSTYVKNYRTSAYNLINKNTEQRLASIRYVDYGKRFYFDVYDLN